MMPLCIPSYNLPPPTKRSAVRRCLFERPTAEKQEKDFETQESRLFEEAAKKFSEKWGLDPISGSIISGAEYECVPVDVTRESVPSFYTKGYPSRKPRPVQSLRRERSHNGLSILPTRLNFDSPKPTKRRCPPEFNGDDQHHCENRESVYDENNAINKRVPEDGDLVIAASDSRSSSSYSSSSLSSSSPSLHGSDSPISFPVSSCLIQNPNLVKSPSMPDISPRSTDLCTPQPRPRSLTQKTIKDYLPCKKARCATKILPRT